jgi:hypothetical protein
MPTAWRRVFILDWDVHHGDGTTTSSAPRTRCCSRASIRRASSRARVRSTTSARAAGSASRSTCRGEGRGRGHVGVARRAHRGSRPLLEFRPELVLISGRLYDATATTRRAAACSTPAPTPRWPGTCARSASGGPRSARCWRAAMRSTRSRSPCARRWKALAGDRPPDSIAPDHVTARAASHIGHHWEL